MNHKSRSTTPFVVIVILIALILLPHNAAATSQDQVDRIEELEARLAALESAAAGAPTVVTYQGYLTDAGGTPLDNVADLRFRIYTAESGGTMVWEETHTDVTVTDGYFTVLLGSAGSSLGASAFSGTERWMQVSVDTGSGYTNLPRHRIAAVPYALSADTLDGMDASDLVPPGVVVMWSGSIGSIPDGWALCDGTNGTPNLRNRFIVGAGGSYAVAATGGEASHTLTIAEMPAHNHGGVTSTDGAHTHEVRYYTDSGSGKAFERRNGERSWLDDVTSTEGAHTHTINSQGGGGAHENRPPYYALAYIMKLP
jgi:microcystin-dependent protein